MIARYHREGRGRSLNAQSAQSAGRYPATRAAKELGVSAAAFRAGVSRTGHPSREWHHVGKYAAAVDFHDTAELGADWRFWLGAAAAYRGPRRAEMMRRAALEREAAKTREHWMGLRDRWAESNRKPRARRIEEIAALCPREARHIIFDRRDGDLGDARAIAAEAARIDAGRRDAADLRRADSLMASAWKTEDAAIRRMEREHALAWWAHGAAPGFAPDLGDIAAAIRRLGQPNASARWAAAELFGLPHDPRSIETVRRHGAPPQSFLRAMDAARAAGRESLLASALTARIRKLAEALPRHRGVLHSGGAWESH